MASINNKQGLLRWIPLGFFLCLCSSLCGFATVEGQTPVWTEDFNGGTIPPEWTVIEGSFSCTNNRLETGTGVWHSAYRASTVGSIEGEWRFDVHYETVAGMYVAFMAEDTTGVGSDKPQNGYIIEVNRYDNVIRLTRHVNGGESRMGFIAMTASNDYSFTVTRNSSSGQFNVWVDGVHSISAVSTHVSTSAYFLVVIVDPGNYIDNIFVYDEIITTLGEPLPSSTPPPPIPGFPAIAIAVAIVTALTIGVLYRRRQSTHPPE